ncbi:Glucans biosynthesis protein C [Novipirellula aureliae]|uniref:Glucans biosynthesis protein C n=1 Tax=Novipirellula aureliae TaxID=2527966 RepID=A0A5C6E0N3_9BACT|nr:acyltransferase [Novipirellula aureliae]TWU41517.1 Glucans biosynthesis protein C [Novipirellula aureliae]
MDILPIQKTFPAAIAPTPIAPTQCSNLVGFDALRAFAALGVVLLHACVPYLQHPMPGLAWSVTDIRSEAANGFTSSAIDCLFWGIEVFIMPIFLLLAGYFAYQTMSRRGSEQLIKTRAKRLLIPLAFASCVVLPIGLYTWVLAWVAEGTVAAVKLKSLKFDGEIDRDLWGLSHLWFMLYLFLYIVATGITVEIWRRYRDWFPSYLHSLCRSIGNRSLHVCAILFLTASATLLVAPEVVWGFQHAFAPVPSKWLYSGSFFAGGLWIAATDPSFHWLRKRRGVLGIASWMFLATAVTLGRWHLEFSNLATGSDWPASVALAIITVAAAWLMTLWLSTASLSLNRLPVSVQYLAAASFWVYLVHHPLLGLTHLDLKLMMPEVNPAAKTAISFAVSVTVSLLTYEAFVRKTRLGERLGMAWEFPGKEVPSTIPMRTPSETSERRRAA